ncbi:MAG: hypothetical protein H0Z34_05720 [Brevibacillus sp.]|nr:hypothetical protein [Brevibacillus sp.]
MTTIIVTILVIGFLIVVSVIAIAGLILKKGVKFLKYRGHRHFSSSDFKYRHHGGYGHHGYGHKHYRHKHSSHRGFFSS